MFNDLWKARMVREAKLDEPELADAWKGKDLPSLVALCTLKSRQLGAFPDAFAERSELYTTV